MLLKWNVLGNLSDRKLVKQLMTEIKEFLPKLYNTVIPLIYDVFWSLYHIWGYFQLDSGIYYVHPITHHFIRRYFGCYNIWAKYITQKCRSVYLYKWVSHGAAFNCKISHALLGIHKNLFLPFLFVCHDVVKVVILKLILLL